PPNCHDPDPVSNPLLEGLASKWPISRSSPTASSATCTRSRWWAWTVRSTGVACLTSTRQASSLQFSTSTKEVSSRSRRGSKKRAQVRDNVARTARHRRGVAAAALMGLDAGDRSWAVVGTDAGELGNPVEDRNLSRPLRLHHAPSVAIAAVAGLEN